MRTEARQEIGNQTDVYGHKEVNYLERVRIGSVDQWISIRGKDSRNPILLILHGGPGCSLIGLVSYFNSELEDSFLVVNWDQRGTCKSYTTTKDFPETMNLEQFLSDTHELIEYLRRRFDKDKVYLLGYSWGSVLGVLTAKRHPELIHAYIGTSQVVNMREAERIAGKFIEREAEARNNSEAKKELNGVNNLTPEAGDLFLLKVDVLRRWVQKFGGAMHGESNLDKLKRAVIASGCYTFRDLINYTRSWEFSVKCLWREMVDIDLFRQAPKLDVPVFLVHGKHDCQTPTEIAKKYFQDLEAPRKNFVIFENSAHHPLFEEPEKFNEILLKRVLGLSVVGALRS